MAKRTPTHFVVSASRTDSGAPTYLTAAGSWSDMLAEAALAQSEEERDLLLTQAQSHAQEKVVCDPYSFGVAVEDTGKLDPLSVREAIRAEGPTTPIRRPD